MLKFFRAFALWFLLPVSAMAFIQATQRPSLNGYGTLALTTASVAISTLTAGPNSAAYPSAGAANGLPNSEFKISNSTSSSGIAYICPLGGTCSSSVGIPLVAGSDRTFTVPGIVTPTAVAASTAVVIIEW